MLNVLKIANDYLKTKSNRPPMKKGGIIRKVKSKKK